MPQDKLRQQVAAHDQAEWVAGIGDCRALVERLETVASLQAGGEVLLEAAA